MKGLRSTLISAIAVGLLAGSAVGVVAQEGSDGSAPSVFTWDVGRPEFSEDPQTGLPVVVVQVEASDPRAEGTATNIEDRAEIEHGGRSYFVLGSSVRLVNDDGSWVGTVRGVGSRELADDGDFLGGAWVTEYTGEDGYAGLSMYTFRVNTGDGPTSIGFIVPSEVVPPFPEPPAE